MRCVNILMSCPDPSLVYSAFVGKQYIAFMLFSRQFNVFIPFQLYKNMRLCPLQMRKQTQRLRIFVGHQSQCTFEYSMPWWYSFQSFCHEHILPLVSPNWVMFFFFFLSWKYGLFTDWIILFYFIFGRCSLILAQGNLTIGRTVCLSLEQIDKYS